jgi:hypothetical protein
VRLVLTALGLTILDLTILERDAESESAHESWALAADAERFTGDPPFGFRPTPDPWPPSWE